jgi:3-oxoacyl-ACP reductase-like protein
MYLPFSPAHSFQLLFFAFAFALDSMYVCVAVLDQNYVETEEDEKWREEQEKEWERQQAAEKEAAAKAAAEGTSATPTDTTAAAATPAAASATPAPAASTGAAAVASKPSAPTAPHQWTTVELTTWLAEVKNELKKRAEIFEKKGWTKDEVNKWLADLETSFTHASQKATDSKLTGTTAASWDISNDQAWNQHLGVTNPYHRSAIWASWKQQLRNFQQATAAAK